MSLVEPGGSRHKYNYSLRKLFTGLTTTALMALKLTVNKAIEMAIMPDNAKIHHCISVLKAKSASHLFITNQAEGEAINIASTTNRKTT